MGKPTIEWTNDVRRLGDLVPWDENPRQITDAQAERIKDSLETFGYSQPIEIEPNNKIIDGHQREIVLGLMDEYGPEAVIDVRVSSREMTRQERKQYIIYKHEGATGQWDFEAVAGLYEAGELQAWGFPDWKADIVGHDWDGAFGGLPTEDRPPFQQMTFTLHDDQVDEIKAALQASKHMGPFDTENENSNGNALARICETFLGDYGQS